MTQATSATPAATKPRTAKAKLWMVPVPLLAPGEVNDLAAQAVLPAETLAVIHGLRHFVAENAKTARAVLKSLVAPCPIQELNIIELNKHQANQDWDRMLAPIAQGFDVGMLSESGCPGIADPGALLARHAHSKGIPVKALVGPSSIFLALMAGGLGGQQFRFNGYLPSSVANRDKALINLERSSKHNGQTELFIETPYRNTVMLQAALRVLKPETWLSVALDLGLPTESVITLTISQWHRRMGERSKDLDAIKDCMAVFSLLA
jgi:16S rRNA (cytidine1402-2'-O)-methyltransferase